jgi:hypothetical protein
MKLQKSPFTLNELLVTIGTIILLMILLFALVEINPYGAHHSSCPDNMKQILLALRMYSEENAEYFPDRGGRAGFEMLRSGGYLENVKMYTCPSSGDMIAGNADLSSASVSYMYAKGFKDTSPGGRAIIIDKNLHTSYKINSVRIRFTNFYKQVYLFPYTYGYIGYINGHVESFPASERTGMMVKSKFEY